MTIDASGGIPGVVDHVGGPLELVRALADAKEVQDCFARHWIQFAYGRTVRESDACLEEQVRDSFERAGYDVRALLLNLTQTDAFLYLDPEQG